MAKTSTGTRPSSKRPRRGVERTKGAKPKTSKRRASAARRRRGGATSRRYAVVYDIEGPRVRLGVLWFVIVMIALVAGRFPTALVYGVAAVAAGGQTARCWQSRRAAPDAAAAALGSGAIVLLAAFGPAPAGVGVMALPVAALVTAGVGRASASRAVADAGITVQSSLFGALAAGSVVLLHGLEPGAAFAVVLIVSAYECGDYLVGTGAPNRFEGPVAGVTAGLVVAFAVAAVEVPPFEGLGSGMLYGAAAALLAPFGQLAASAVLPRAASRSPALRRLDSLLLAGPIWYVALDLTVV